MSEYLHGFTQEHRGRRLELAKVSKFKPLAHQPLAIDKLLENKYHILADDMGLGKTFEFLAACLILQEKTVISCPAYLKGVWEKEIEAVCLREEDKKLFKITSYSKSKDLLEILNQHKAKILGFDEGHYLKNMEAKRTINSFEAIADYGIDRLYILSGTPIKNRIPEWYALLRLIHWHLDSKFLEQFPTEWSFSIYFCYEKSFVVKHKNSKRGRRVTKFYGLRTERQKELLSWIRPIMTRRLAKDVLDIEEPTFIHVDADISDQFDEDLVEAFEKGTDSAAKRKSALAKVPFTIKFVEDLLNSVEQLVVFTCHPEAALQLKEKFAKSEVIIGDTPVDKRQPIIDRFQKGEIKNLFCTIGAASTGYTMTAAHVMVFNDMSYVVGDNEQAWKRIVRYGQTKACLLYCIGGSKKDTEINKSLEEKAKDLDKGY